MFVLDKQEHAVMNICIMAVVVVILAVVVLPILQQPTVENYITFLTIRVKLL